MNILDIIILICFIPVMIGGFRKGFIDQAISIISLIGGVWVAYGLGDIVGNWIQPMMEGISDNPENIANLVGFGVIFLIATGIFMLLGRFGKKAFLKVIPDFINKLLGLVLAVANGLLVLATIFMVFNVLNQIYLFADLKEALFSDSFFLPIIDYMSKTILPNIINMIL